jgi:hypothetical protein
MFLHSLHTIKTGPSTLQFSSRFCSQTKNYTAGIERTKDQWERLLNSAGLKMLEVVNYDKHFEDSVIIAGLN